MSYGSIHVIMGVLKNLLHYGQELGCFPAELLKFPRIPAGGKEIRIMSKEDFRKLDAFLSEGLDPFTFGILLCMYTGIRVGELCGLKWEDLDFSHRKIYIRRTVTRVKNLDVTFSEGKGVSPRTRLNIGTPKTSTSIREIPFGPSAFSRNGFEEKWQLFSPDRNGELRGTPYGSEKIRVSSEKMPDTPYKNTFPPPSILLPLD